VVTQLRFSNPANDPLANGAAQGRAAPAGGKVGYIVDLDMRLADVISTADEAVQTARRLERRLTDSFGKEYRVTMTTEPVGAQAAGELKGTLSDLVSEAAVNGAARQDAFRAAYRIEKVGQ